MLIIHGGSPSGALVPADSSPDLVEGRVVEMLPLDSLVVEPDRVLGLPVAVPGFPGPDVFLVPGAPFFGDPSVTDRLDEEIVPCTDVLSDPSMLALRDRVFWFVRRASPSGLSLVFLAPVDPRPKQSTGIGAGLTFATGMREPPL